MGGAGVTGTLSSAVDRIKVQLVSVRKRIARGRKSERFIREKVKKIQNTKSKIQSEGIIGLSNQLNEQNKLNLLFF
ncbi:MAG: hypothetical protein WCK88_04155 [bacterium]